MSLHNYFTFTLCNTHSYTLIFNIYYNIIFIIIIIFTVLTLNDRYHDTYQLVQLCVCACGQQCIGTWDCHHLCFRLSDTPINKDRNNTWLSRLVTQEQRHLTGYLGTKLDEFLAFVHGNVKRIGPKIFTSQDLFIGCMELEISFTGLK